MNKTLKTSKLFWCFAAISVIALNVLFSAPSFAQGVEKRTVTGVVSDDLGPIAGAAVVVSGSSNGAMTDMDGKYTLSGVTLNDVIQVSCLGYETQEILFSGQETINVTLSTEAEFLEGTVVTALGIKRSEKALSKLRELT